MLEFALSFLAFLILLMGVFEVGRAMWTYHTLAGSAKRAARYMIVRGERCAEMSSSCAASIGQISALIRKVGLGLDPNQLEVSLSAGNDSVDCLPLSSCLNTATLWPASPNNAVGRRVTIRVVYPFQPILGNFWPENKRQIYRLAATSSESIQF